MVFMLLWMSASLAWDWEILTSIGASAISEFACEEAREDGAPNQGFRVQPPAVWSIHHQGDGR